ncbi:MAG: HPF/RaiA family ribosome-associated protein [Treponema sp.]|nr:HPF/RaiA family ribosome-associated protein [Spirochaetia bacterium]MDY2840590.1 HPF/RaiA family ribosome-associated protein [Treponema sp.]MDY5123972.1 HPF/RaiA family ribosome-associated protein [Treponema sp.]
MNTACNAQGFTLSEKQTGVIESKLKRIAYAEDLIVDLKIIVKHEQEYDIEATANFKWGVQAHVSGKDEDFTAAVNKMMDVLDNKVKKEKDKVQEKK